jgi:hypothetical protein
MLINKLPIRHSSLGTSVPMKHFLSNDRLLCVHRFSRLISTVTECMCDGKLVGTAGAVIPIIVSNIPARDQRHLTSTRGPSRNVLKTSLSSSILHCCRSEPLIHLR